MIELIVSCHTTSHRLCYGEDRELAEAELATLRPKMGGDRYENRGKELTHTIKCPLGDVVVVLEKVEVARIVDGDLAATMQTYELTKADDRDIERHIKFKKAVANAGLSDTA